MVPALRFAATVTFNSPGTHVWKVPAGVRFATFDLYGAYGQGLGAPAPTCAPPFGRDHLVGGRRACA